MKNKLLGRLLTVALVASAAVAGAYAKNSANLPQSDADIARHVRHEIAMYPYYSIWDDVSFRVSNGQVALTGAVNLPFKRSDIERIVRQVPGVTGVASELRVLPLSPADDRLRIQVARAIYRDATLSRYGMQAVPPIHVIVDNGHVTLEGVVSTQTEKNIAGLRASGAGLSFGPITNNLVVENPPKKS